jgi:hypothetical protein
MNWKQLHTASSYHERIELMVHMLSTVERRSRRWLLVRGRLHRDRRTHRPRAHVIPDRRDPQRTARQLHRAMFVYILTLIYMAAVLMTFHE